MMGKTTETSFIECSEGNVGYELAGPPDGEAVVLVHGLVGNKAMWSPLFELLAEAGCRVLRFDLYGRGESDKPEIDYHLPLFIFQILEITESLELQKPFHLVGLSMGALVSAAFASELREFVKDVVLISPAGVGVGVSRLMELAKIKGIGEMAVKTLSATPMLENAIKKLAAETGQDEIAGMLENNLKDPAYQHAILSTIRNIDLENGHEHYSVLGLSRRPAMVLWGEKDKLVPIENKERLVELMPASKHKVYAGSGHMPNTEMSEAVLGDILAFWQAGEPNPAD